MKSASGGDRLVRLGATIASRSPWLLPALVVTVGIVPTVLALHAQTFAIFGRDQGIFQYVAWALRNGERAYRDIHEINGPLPHAWYVVMQRLGGEDEHVFRTLDTVLLVLTYLLASATVPRWVGLSLGGRGALGAVWALAGLTIFGAQYVRYDWWHTSQREGLYSVLLLASLAMQAIGHTSRIPRRALLAFLGCGVTTSLPWFGKPPCVVFSVLQLVVLGVDRKSLSVSIRGAVGAALIGALAVGASMGAFVVAYGDVASGIELLSKVPRLHHTIWNETLFGAYRAFNNAPRLDWACATFFAFLAAFHVLRLPRRALLATVLPIGGFVVFAGQGKAFPYHLHMLTLGTGVAQLVLVAAVAKHMIAADISDRPKASRLRAWFAVAGAIAAVGLGAKSAEDAWLSPGVRGDWRRAGATAEQRANHAYVEHFPWGDFFANDLRTAAAYLSFHTRAEERVQTYGFDPYLLFLARRKSASPVIYGFELNVDAALKGGPGAHASPELQEWLRAYRAAAESLVLRSVMASPPAAFALFDRAPFTFPENADRDFEEHCPALYHWMSTYYEEAATFGTIRIWLRRDVLKRPLP
jgi:hypothetical protein